MAAARRFVCEVEGCGKAFTRNDNMMTHVRSVHEGARPFKCTVDGCGKAFHGSGGLKTHVRSVHEGARPFKCTVAGCGKTFKKSGNLKTHIRGVHEGARPFTCTVEGCGRAFQDSGHLKTHVRGVHEVARPFKCTVEGCGKTFKKSDHLKTHVQSVHEGARPFKCTVDGCGKAFTQNGSLKRHVQSVHEGARPFKCAIEGCGKTFTRSGILKTHVRSVHDGARPFKCTVEGCAKTFAENGKLNRHTRTVHGGQDQPLAGNVGTNSSKRQSADPRVIVKIEDDQDQIVEIISASALESASDQQIKNEHETPQDDARLHFFRHLDSQARLGARVICEFELDDGAIQHYRGRVNGVSHANPCRVDILFDDGDQRHDWPVEDILLVESLSPDQEVLFLVQGDAGAEESFRRFTQRKRRPALSTAIGEHQQDEDLTTHPAAKRSKLEDTD